MVSNTKEVKARDFDIVRSAEEKRELSFSDDICIGCGICEKMCPVEAIELGDIGAIIRTGADKSKIEVDENKCVLCGMCSAGCPVDALDLKIDDVSIKTMDVYPKYLCSAEIDDDTCIYCQACETACPREAITVARELPDRSKLVTGEIEIDKDTCINCGVCEEMCPADAITIDHKLPTSDDPTVASDINVDTDKCVYCLVCKKACPVDAIKASCRICSYGDYDLNPEDFKIKGRSFIDDDQCVNCGWCQEICPVDAAKVEKPFEGELSIDEDTCQACGACVDICPCSVLSFPHSTEPGQIAQKLVSDEKYCIYVFKLWSNVKNRCCPVPRNRRLNGTGHPNTHLQKSKSWGRKQIDSA